MICNIDFRNRQGITSLGHDWSVFDYKKNAYRINTYICLLSHLEEERNKVLDSFNLQVPRQQVIMLRVNPINSWKKDFGEKGHRAVFSLTWKKSSLISISFLKMSSENTSCFSIIS